MPTAASRRAVAHHPPLRRLQFQRQATARRLDLHTNTVYFRLNRIRELTGIDPRSYSGLSLLLTTLRILDGHAPKERNTP